MPNETIQTFLKADRADLEVPRGREITIGPGERRPLVKLHDLEIRSVEDLQVLGLVPEEIEEGKLRKAIMRDDQLAWEAAERIVETGGEPCGCDSAEREHSSARSDLSSRFRALRRQRHRALAELVSEELASQVEWDSPIVKSVHGWLSRVDKVKVVAIKVALIKDITIGHDSTLHLASQIKSLWAGDIRIHVGGKLRSASSYIKIRCRSIEGSIP